MEKLLVELQDENGNIYYLHTDGRVVFCSDGESVESKLNKKVNAADIINNCTSTATNKPLAAAQGKTLWERITSVITSLTNHQSSADHDGRYYTETEINTKLNTKITASGGDAADAKVSGFTANNTSFPVPAAGQTFRVMWGIMAKFCNDVKSSCFLISNIVNNCTSTATNKALSAAQGKALWDKYTQLNSDLAWAGLTFTPSSTYVTDNYTYAYRMGNVCLCALSFAAKVKLNAWAKVVVGTVSLPSKMACFCMGYAQNAAKSVVFSVGNIVESSSEGRNIYLETLNQTIEAGDWLRGFLIYFYRN